MTTPLIAPSPKLGGSPNLTVLSPTIGQRPSSVARSRSALSMSMMTRPSGSSMGRHPSIRRTQPPSIPRLESLIKNYISSSCSSSPSLTQNATSLHPTSQPLTPNLTTISITSTTATATTSRGQLSIALREALMWSVVRGDVGMLSYLLALEGEAADILKTQALTLRDPDDHHLTSLSIISAAGSYTPPTSLGAGMGMDTASISTAGAGMNSNDDIELQLALEGADSMEGKKIKKLEDREEIVRMLVRKWGIIDGRDGRRTGVGEGYSSWHPLHLASLLSSPPLTSFLLTQGCSPHSLTSKGLTPLDLIDGMRGTGREEVGALLSGAMEGEVEDGLITPNLGMGTPGVATSEWDEDGRVSSTFGGESRFGFGRGEGGHGGGGLSHRRRQMLERHRITKAKRTALLSKLDEKRKEKDDKDFWVREKLSRMGVVGQSVELMLWSFEDKRKGIETGWVERQRQASSGSGMDTEVGGGNDLDEELEFEDEEDDGVEEGSELGGPEEDDGDFGSFGGGHGGDSRSLADQLGGGGYESEEEGDRTMRDQAPPDIDDASFLVWTLDHLEVLMEIFIRSYPPQAFPLSRRNLPANAIYLCAKFALHRCDEHWLMTMLEQATLNVERVCLDHTNDLAFLAFWVYNVTLLLHLIQCDNLMVEACEESQICVMLEEMLNALQVHIIRVAETKIDKLLDAALLDYETIDDLADVRFDDEWAIFRGLTSKAKKKVITPSVTDVFNPNASPGSTPTRTVAERLASSVNGKDISRQQSIADMKGGGNSSPLSSLRRLPTEQEEVTPRHITDILSGTLLVLQLYEINPALIVQMISQIYLWMASEIFNRMIAQGKKYLCRSRAVQIKMNVSALEDWVRKNGLPPALFSRHFERLSQLVQWLQCSSQLKDFDMLIATMQNMSALNPLQMRRAVKDYHFEVNESRMTDECAQYLAQLQRDWERRRVRIGVEAIQRQVNLRKSMDSGEDMSLMSDQPVDENTIGSPIDQLFDSEFGLGEYLPSIAPASIGELEDSRFMIPLVLPSNQYLRAISPPGSAYSMMTVFDNINNNSTSTGAGGGKDEFGRPSSRSSVISSRRPLGWLLRSGKKLRTLPSDFIPWLQKTQKSTELQMRSRKGGLLSGPGVGAGGEISPTYEMVGKGGDTLKGQPGRPNSLFLGKGGEPRSNSSRSNVSVLQDAFVQNDMIDDPYLPRTRVNSDPSSSSFLGLGSPLRSAKPLEGISNSAPTLPLSAPLTGGGIGHQQERSGDNVNTQQDLASPTKSKWWKPRSRVATDGSTGSGVGEGVEEDVGETPTITSVKRQLW